MSLTTASAAGWSAGAPVARCTHLATCGEASRLRSETCNAVGAVLLLLREGAVHPPAQWSAASRPNQRSRPTAGTLSCAARKQLRRARRWTSRGVAFSPKSELGASGTGLRGPGKTAERALAVPVDHEPRHRAAADVEQNR